MHLLVSVGAQSGGFVVFGAVGIRAVVEGAVPASEGPATALVLEVPVEAGEGTVLLAFVLQKQGALVHTELFEISEKEEENEELNKEIKPVYQYFTFFCYYKLTYENLHGIST